MITTRQAVRGLAAALLMLPLAANAWWSDDWSYRKTISFDTTPTGAAIDETLTNMPMLVRLSAGNFEFWGDVKPDGADIRFIAGDDVTPIPFYIEKWDPATQIGLVWVQMPRLAPGAAAENVYMYYGNADAPSGAEPGRTFDTAVRLALDFSAEDGSFRDSTAYSNHPQNNGAAYTAASLIGGGATLDAAATLQLPLSPGFVVSPSTGFTLSMWVRPSDASTFEPVLASLTSADGVGSVVIGARSGTGYATLTSPTQSIQLVATSQTIAAGQWAHVALRIAADSTDLYINGFAVATGDALASDISGQWVIGDLAGGFAGDVDRVLISASAAPAAALKLAASNEAPFSTIMQPGQDESDADGGGGHPNYFLITLRNVTVDGWVVIVICVIMAIISWIIMWMKGSLLSRVERQNKHFMEQYQRITGDPLALDVNGEIDTHREESVLGSAVEDPASYHPSTLFPLYHAGALEVKKRLGQRSPAVGSQAAGFSAETISAIGASIDAAHVRQRQKLDNLMVLLTIAISGGPFLGLLGTVVGVMITFAAIAATGDVNVNSIAPGIAAALAATVAGLVVAIPALFGYNWLGARIKSIDANTQVFADEYVNKIAEHYC